ncbi:MAG TPA: SIS domain-containing protein [Candidatus Lokiarchaeia archaeon]|nr:SIS domain-containing protein [Candidatus Lokiarchaeia archaeon]
MSKDEKKKSRSPLAKEEASTKQPVVNVLDQKQRKLFDLHGDRESVESTSEYPVMYKALHSEPRWQHPFNVYNDISTEPSAVEKTLALTDNSTTTIAEEIISKDIKLVVNVGLPTSLFVGMNLANALVKYASIQSWYIDSAEFIMQTSGNFPYDMEHTAFFMYSGSGSTYDTIEAARIVQEKAGYSVAFTSIAGSPITEKCSSSIVAAGGMDTGGSDTFHYATRLASGLSLAFKLGKRLDPGKGDFDGMLAQLNDVPKIMRERWDYWDGRSRSIGQRFCRKRAVIVVGGGANVGSAEEMALKFNEMASMPAHPMVPTRHLHGVFGLTDENIVTFIIAPPSPYEKWLHQVAEVTTILKAPAVAIVNDEETEIADQVDYVVRIPSDNECIFSVLAVPILQLIPYYFAVADGTLNPDCQRSNIPKHARAWNRIFPPGSH